MTNAHDAQRRGTGDRGDEAGRYAAFDALVALQDGDPLQMPRIMNLILTPEQKAAVYEACRDENGRVPIEAVNDEILAIFNAFNESKLLIPRRHGGQTLWCATWLRLYHIFDYRALPLFRRKARMRIAGKQPGKMRLAETRIELRRSSLPFSTV